DRAAIALLARELELDPVVAAAAIVPVDEQRTLLIGDHDVEHAAIPQVGQGHRAPVVLIGDAGGLRGIHPSLAALVHQHARALVARQAAILDGRPLRGVLDDVADTHRHLVHLIPVFFALAAGRDEAVGHEQVAPTVVVEVAELRAPRPATVGHHTA